MVSVTSLIMKVFHFLANFTDFVATKINFVIHIDQLRKVKVVNDLQCNTLFNQYLIV